MATSQTYLNGEEIGAAIRAMYGRPESEVVLTATVTDGALVVTAVVTQEIIKTDGVTENGTSN